MYIRLALSARVCAYCRSLMQEQERFHPAPLTAVFDVHVCSIVQLEVCFGHVSPKRIISTQNGYKITGLANGYPLEQVPVSSNHHSLSHSGVSSTGLRWRDAVSLCRFSVTWSHSVRRRRIGDQIYISDWTVCAC